MRPKFLFTRFLILLYSIFLVSCSPGQKGGGVFLKPKSSDFSPSSAEEKLTFKKLNDEIFSKKCQSCHNPLSVKDPKMKVTTDFTSYESVIKNAVKPKDPDNSLVYAFTLYGFMPYNQSPLSKEELAKIKNWILQGAIFDENTEVVIPKETNIDGAVLYTNICMQCHGALASSSKRGKTASDIQNAINSNKGNMGSLPYLTPQEIEAIARALNL